MNVTPQGVEDHQTVLHIEVEPERVQRAMQQAARRLSQQYKIPGFRPGKAPYSIILQRFGADSVREAALEELGPQVYREAVEQQAIEPYAPGQINLIVDDPVTFRALVPMRPSVDAGDYRRVKVDLPDYEVSDDDVEDIIENLQNEQATWTPVERPAQLEDRITATIHGEVDGERIIDVHDQEVELIEASFAQFPPGFLDEVIGMAAGDSREFDLAYPDNDDREALRGKTAHFEVSVEGVKEKSLPELDDQFAKDLGLNEVETLEALEQRIRINESARRARDARGILEERVLDATIEQAIVNYPPILVANELEGELERQEQSMQRIGFTLENYLRFSNMNLDQFRAQLAPGVERRVQRALLLDEIARRENLSAPEGTPETQQGTARLTAALNWLIESAAGVGTDWPPVPVLNADDDYDENDDDIIFEEPEDGEGWDEEEEAGEEVEEVTEAKR